MPRMMGLGAELGGKSEISMLNSGSSGFHHLPFPLPTRGEKKSPGPPQADTWEELMCLGCDLAAQSKMSFSFRYRALQAACWLSPSSLGVKHTSSSTQRSHSRKRLLESNCTVGGTFAGFLFRILNPFFHALCG